MAGLSVNDTLICPGGSIQFTDESMNSPTSWYWSFPGATPNSSTDENPVVTYPNSGNYDVTLVAINNDGQDTLTYQAYIHVSTALQINGVKQDLSCFGSHDGAIDISVSGGTPGYSYNWSNGTTTQDLQNLTAGTFTVTATDNNGCGSQKIFVIDEPAAIQLTFAPVNASCGNNDGSIALSVTGGTQPV